jgi:predicted dithiol-disulfide oxidoreductase (DUF899 family)
MTKHKVGTREDWLAARAQLLIREKEHTRLGDDIARQRRELLGSRWRRSTASTPRDSTLQASRTGGVSW